eukprot:CAMPEP_0198117048 /NCGR_PEP_ID=MMETSP1442-20131203/16205_1 /TAXON_ID= /ORGANISM="Craspedostauros australis, Strain CCMP3328" /LENGTH=183 /DNA_ID=CAMNT_0043775011 /DNA_START=337 /DNA_END=888 /DNA_ORIENTATION=+
MSSRSSASALLRNNACMTISRRSLSDEAASKESTNDDEEEPIVQYAFTPPTPLSQASHQKIEDLFQRILWLDFIELHLLTQLIHEAMGVDPARFAGGGGSATVAVAKETTEEDTRKEVKLVGFDAKAKIKVIKEVRAITGLGLKDAKAMVDGVPKTVQKDMAPDQAEELKAQLEAVGAVVEIV